MSVLTERTLPSAGAAIRALAGDALVRVKGAMARLRPALAPLARRKHINVLAGLDDRMLADIGLTRSDLQVASRWSLWTDPGDRLAAASEERRAARERS